MIHLSEYLSHISADNRKQTISEHLHGTADLCGKFASHIRAEELGRLTGLAHDLGKYSPEFQQRLQNNGKKVDHASAGAVECCRRNQPYAAYAVLGHHGGLPNGGEPDASAGATFFARVRRAMNGGLCDYSAWKTEMTLSDAAHPDWLYRDPLTDVFFTRMLYSCLVDADYLDTAEFMLGEPYFDASYADITELNRRFDHYVSGWFSPGNELNARRCEILSACMAGADIIGSELFTLTVPTGGGKTTASLAFALRRAMRTDAPKRRIIYVIPYTSIIEQTAEIFRNILGDDNVLEHHSGIKSDTEDELNQRNIRRQRASENWDAPVIVTTAVQFFESLYASRSSDCRKLHNIADSVIIFDEAQMLPLPYLRPCIHAVSQLIAHYGVTAVLCTATQPVLEPFFKEFLPDITPVELCPVNLQNDDVFKRVSFRLAGCLAPTTLADELNRQHQVLCIVNSRAAAAELYRLLRQDGSAFHLSTLMTAIDRKRVLAVIRSRLKENQPCCVISTSLIEAGVDVDFPAVYREEAGLDSILQAAGRCNREGKRRHTDSMVTIFKSEKKPPELFAQAIAAAQKILRTYDEISSPEAVRQYFRFYYQIKGDHYFDRKKILHQLASDTRPIRTVAEQFRLIEENTMTVYIPIGEGRRLIEQVRCGNIGKQLMRQLGQYGVSVYENDFRILIEAGDIETIGEGFYVLANMQRYSPHTGLSMAHAEKTNAV